jgi:hypothetical protein
MNDNRHSEDKKSVNHIEKTGSEMELPERRELFRKAAFAAAGLALGGSAGFILSKPVAQAQTTTDCFLTDSEMQFANTVDMIFNDPNYLNLIQTAPDQALQQAGYTLTDAQLQALQSANYNIAPESTDQYMAIPTTRPVVRIITRGTRPVVRVVTKGTQPVVSVVVNTVVSVVPPDPDPTATPTPTPSPTPYPSPTPTASPTPTPYPSPTPTATPSPTPTPYPSPTPTATPSPTPTPYPSPTPTATPTPTGIGCVTGSKVAEAVRCVS